ncbi:MAG: FG-GAP repeat domain-containing protein [Planctomycetota bacterium]
MAVACQQPGGVAAPQHAPRLRQLELAALPTRPYRWSIRGPHDGAATLATGDLDGDGHIDLFLGAGRPIPPRFLRNDGHGRSSEVLMANTLGPGALHWQSELIDMDADGDLDVVAANYESAYGATVSLYLNDGGWRFRDVSGVPARGFIMPAAPTNNSDAVAVADFDGDGDPDIVASGSSRGRSFSSCYFFENDGATHFHYRASRFPADQGARQATSGSLTAVDIDSDGDVDILGPAYAPGSAYWINDGTGHFVDGAQQRYDAASYPYGVFALSLGDVDGDGDLDMIGTRSVLGPPLLVLNDGRGYFAYATPTHLPPDSVGGTAIEFLDLDSDGDLDVVSSIPPLPWNFFGRHEVLLNDGSGHFTRDLSRRILAESPNGRVYDFDGADFDHDGDIDLVESSQTSEPNPPRSLPYHLNTTRHVYTSIEPSLGTSLPVRVCGPSGSTTWLAIGLASVLTPMPGVGRLGLDPASMAIWPNSLRTGESREVEFRVDIPNLPQIVGSSLYFQGILVEVPARLTLTNTWEVTIR